MDRISGFIKDKFIRHSWPVILQEVLEITRFSAGESAVSLIKRIWIRTTYLKNIFRLVRSIRLCITGHLKTVNCLFFISIYMANWIEKATAKSILEFNL